MRYTVHVARLPAVPDGPLEFSPAPADQSTRAELANIPPEYLQPRPGADRGGKPPVRWQELDRSSPEFQPGGRVVVNSFWVCTGPDK